jgi:hypothetical protein
VPARFRVRPQSVCARIPGDTVQVGPAHTGLPCWSSARLSTSVVLTTSAVAAREVGGQLRTVFINGISVQEAAMTDGGAYWNGQPQTLSYLWVIVPSHDAALLVTAPGSVRSGALSLAYGIADTLKTA